MLLGLPDLIGSGLLVAGVLLGVLLVVPAWALTAATGWPWPLAVGVWLVVVVVVTLFHPLLRVPLHRPWLVVTLRSDQPWADRSAWQVRGWRNSLDAVTEVADTTKVSIVEKRS